MTDRGAGRGSPDVQEEWYRLEPPIDQRGFPELGEDPIESLDGGGVRWSGTCPRLVGTDRLSLPAELFREELPHQLQTLLGEGHLGVGPRVLLRHGWYCRSRVVARRRPWSTFRPTCSPHR